MDKPLLKRKQTLASILIVVIQLAATMLGSAVGHADPLDSWLSQKTMTGDWGGKRVALAAMGILPHASYLGEFADVLSGGRRQGNGYAQQFAFGADFDMEKLAELQGGTLRINFSAREGRNVSADFIGNEINVQEVYGAGENFRLAEVSYEQVLDRQIVDIKGGFYPMGNDFGRTPLLCAFQNDSFCAHPTLLPDSSGWSDNPTAKWGGRLLINVAQSVYAQAGVYDVNPTYSQHDNGLKVGLSGSTGAIFPVEFGVNSSVLAQAILPGHYKIGAYYDTSSVRNVVETNTFDKGRYGAYFLADQMVFSLEPGQNRGVILFLQGAMADSRTSTVQNMILTGIILQGPFQVRPQDTVYIGYARTGLNRRLIHSKNEQAVLDGIGNEGLEGAESAVEFGYEFQATPWFLIHPNIQYIGDPGAFSYKHVQDAWVFGLQTGVTF